MSNYSDDERNAIIASMLEDTLPPLRQPGDLTLDEYLDQMEADGYEYSSREQIRKRLAALVDAGELQREKCWDNDLGRSVTVYRAVKEAG
jgi:hypothetical protein